MVEIGDKPMIWHIMKIYSRYGINDFIICLGHKGHYIKEYFISYKWLSSSISVDLEKNSVTPIKSAHEPWRIDLIDTGNAEPTGERLRRVRDFLDKDRPFCLTYGDGLTDLNLNDTFDFHAKHGRLATVTAVLPPGRFGALRIVEEDVVSTLTEKPKGKRGDHINGGFMVMSPKALDYLDASNPQMLEKGMLVDLTRDRQLMAYKYDGFWQPMDTIRDVELLRGLWASGEPPWRVWSS
jgi:glucose-1-phosphate cytidylyltransferase